jgi:hypothetical protein
MKDVAKLLLCTFLIVAGVLLLMVLSDIVNPHNPIEVEVEEHFIVYPETQDDWAETAHALGVHPDSLTLDEFYEHSILGSVEEVQEYMRGR